MRDNVFTLILITLLAGLAAASIPIHVVGANGPIYIRADEARA